MNRDVGKGFDRLAAVYDLLVKIVFGRSLYRAQCAQLAHLPQGAELLLIGGGTGWLLKPLCEQAKPARISYVDASAHMIARAKAFVQKEIPQWEAHIQFIQGTQEDIPAIKSYEVIITPFFLDLFSEKDLPGVFQKLNASLDPEGYWYLIDFQVPKQRNKLFAKALIWLMYRFFRLFTGMSGTQLIDPTPYFQKHQFDLRHEKLFYGKMVKSQMWEKKKESS